MSVGGRGVGGPEKFSVIEDLARSLGAAVGASRAVTDAGWRPANEQIGLDLAVDRQRFVVSDEGVVVVPKDARF